MSKKHQSKKHLYIVSSYFAFPFFSLEDAKWNVKTSFTRQEALKYFKGKNEVINHYVGDNLISETPIFVDNRGNISFGKTSKFI